MSEKVRVAYWDNLKGILIFLVVVGHFILGLKNDHGKIVEGITYLIYMFHMPAFVFVSGYFSKSFVSKGKKDSFSQTGTIIAYLMLYVIYLFLIQIMSAILYHKWKMPSLLYVEAAPWYMLCMAMWMMFLAFFHHFKPGILIPFTIVTALFFSINKNTGTFLSLTRFVVFLPFFLLGYYLKWEHIEKLIKTKYRVVAAVVFALSVVFICLNLEKIDKFSAILYAAHSYASVPTTTVKAIILRIGWYGLASIMTACIIILTPKKKTILTKIGENTLGIYIIHRLVKDILYKFEIFSNIKNDIVLISIIIVISALCCLIFSANGINKLMKLPFRLKYEKLRQKSPTPD